MRRVVLCLQNAFTSNWLAWEATSTPVSQPAGQVRECKPLARPCQIELLEKQKKYTKIVIKGILQKEQSHD